MKLSMGDGLFLLSGIPARLFYELTFLSGSPNLELFRVYFSRFYVI